MIVHRLIRIVCVLGSGLAPILVANLMRFVSRVAVKQVFPHSEGAALPAFSQTWVEGIASGRVPIIPIASVISLMIVALGFHLVFSKRLSSDASGTALSLLCCLGYTVSIITIFNTLMGIILPFVPLATG